MGLPLPANNPLARLKALEEDSMLMQTAHPMEQDLDDFQMLSIDSQNPNMFNKASRSTNNQS